MLSSIMLGLTETGVRSLVCCLALTACLLSAASISRTEEDSFDKGMDLSFKNGTLEGWTVDGEDIWTINKNPQMFTSPGDADRFVVNSYNKGEENTGVLRSHPFTITQSIQRFSVAGWDGKPEDTNGASSNYVLLRSYPDNEILRKTHTPGGDKLVPTKWFTSDLVGCKVYLEVVDGNPKLHPGGYAWIAFSDYRQDGAGIKKPVDKDDLFGLKIDQNAEISVCRTVPFYVASPQRRGDTTRQQDWQSETIPVGASARTLYLLGMMNEGGDSGVAFWGDHAEIRAKRDDQIYVGCKLGSIEIRYADGKSDHIPVVVGATAWFVYAWGDNNKTREPFVSRPDYAAILAKSLKIRESDEIASDETRQQHYYLAVKPRHKKIESIIIHNNPDYRGRPVISAVTLAGAAPVDNLVAFGKWKCDASDIEPAVDTQKPQDWSKDLDTLARCLYTSESDLPERIEPLEFPAGLDAAKIKFIGGRDAAMLNNIWVANLLQMNEKFEKDTGLFRETGKDTPWYGGYLGFGTWLPIGVIYQWAYSRSAEEYAVLPLRCINEPERTSSFVDFCDKWLYFYRSNHDADKGPDNSALDVSKYPKDAPPHWAFMLNLPHAMPAQINEIAGDEETDGHGCVTMARWYAWRLMGAPKGDWLTAPRKDVYDKSRWDSTKDAAEFICWMMDYTGRDVMYSEGEGNGWCSFLSGFPAIPKGWANETDPAKIKWNYANADVYEVFATYACLTGLRCSAEIADAVGDGASAQRWRTYADRLQSGMIRELRTGDYQTFTWRWSPYCIYPSLQESLVQAWFAIYYDGMDPNKLDYNMTSTTRNTLKKHLSLPYGFAPTLGMGYGQGWLTTSALVLDDMDSSGPLLCNIAKYTYDKNMTYVDTKRGIDWRKWLWIVPEGTNILPDGRWHRIGDLSNGANQGPCMHAMEVCAGIDDTKPADIKIMPRVPKPLKGIAVDNWVTLIPSIDGLDKVKVKYSFTRPGKFFLKSSIPIPTLSVRLGPYDEVTAQKVSKRGKKPAGCSVRVDKSGTWEGKDACWIWIEGIKNAKSISLDFTK